MFDPKMIVLIAVVAILGFGAFWGFVRKLKRTLLRLVTLLLAFGGAFLLVEIIGKSVGRYIVSLLQPVLGDSVATILSQPEMALVVDALCEMIAAPILFLIAYMVLKVVTWIIYKFIAVLLGIKGPRLCGRLTGALAGVLCGMVGLVVFVTPVFGYMTLANDVLKQLSPEAQGEQQPNVLEQMMEAPVAKQSYQLVGRHMFRSLTTVDFEDGKINLQEEASAVISIWEDATTLTGASFEQYSEREAQALKKMAADVGTSKIVSTVVASFLSDASESWLNGEQALRISKPNMGEDVQGIADAFLTVFCSATPTTLAQDLGTFADAFGVLVEADLFTVGTGNADFVTRLVSEGVVNKLYIVLDANPRMAPIKTAIRDTGVRVMMTHLGAPETLREDHSDMLEDMANTLKSVTKSDGTIDQAALSAGIHEVMNGYEVTVNEEASQLIAEAMVEYLTPEEIQTLSSEQLADKLAERFVAAGNQLPVSTGGAAA